VNERNSFKAIEVFTEATFGCGQAAVGHVHVDALNRPSPISSIMLTQAAMHPMV
jgi:hypothetical protein